MTRFFRLRDDVTIPGRWHIGELRLADGSVPLLDAGVRFNEHDPLIGTITHPGQVLDFGFTSFAVPLATRALAEAVVSAAGSDVQRIPVIIAGQAGIDVLNSVRVVSCVDEKKSEFTRWTAQDHRADLAGQYRQMTKLVLDASAIPNEAHFFRVEGWLIALIVSEKVKIAMEAAGCRGAKFTELPTSRSS